MDVKQIKVTVHRVWTVTKKDYINATAYRPLSTLPCTRKTQAIA